MNVFLSWLSVLSVLLAFFDTICEGTRIVAPRPRNNHRIPVLSSCPMPKLKHGTVRMQRAGRMAYFFCSRGYEIHGPMNIVCQNGRWKQEIPICIKPGCEVPANRSNGFVMIDEKKETVMLFCKEGYLSAGTTIAFCDGQQWDRELGECRLDRENPKICDFETGNVCEWTQDGENDFPWLRKNGWNSYEKIEFGPKHDHTKGKPLEGHYMVAEGTNTRTTQSTRLWSPMYTSSDSKDACFRFYYHMYGSKIGRLRVILKPYEMLLDDVVDNPKFILFEKHDSQGNQWNEEVSQIESVETDFQIIFEATGSNGLINDIAIDDVALMNGSDCVKYLTPEPVSEENGGIFGIQSCADRCTETQSFRLNGSTTFIEDGAIIEKCDCHQECLDLGTCCTDYQIKCLENEPTEADVNTTPVEDAFTEISTNVAIKVTVPTERTTQKILNSTIVSTSTQASTPTTVPTTAKTSTRASIPTSTLRSTSTSVIATTSTPKLTTPTTKLTTTSTQTTIRTKTPTLATTSIKPITSSTLKPTIDLKMPKKPPKPIPTKSTGATVKVTERISKPTFPTKTTVPTKSSISTKTTSTSSKPATKTTQTTISMITKTILWKSSRRSVSMTSSLSPSKTPTTTDATLNAMLMPSDNSRVASLSTIIAICIFLTLMLIGWRHFNTNKWNQFNSHQIEFKSNYQAEGTEESLIRSDSFIIDDSFNETLIDDFDVDERTPCNGIKIDPTPKKTEVEKVSTRATSRTKKSLSRLGKDCDQYSEKRCLTADDEQFDFTMQTTLL